MAVTINAPPRDVWPWLVQMGHDRGGWYSWDRLDNFGRRSAQRSHPEWQQIDDDLLGRPFDPAKERPLCCSDSLWGFLLEALPDECTRLVVSGYWALRPRLLLPIANSLLYEPEHRVMQTRQFANLKRLAEGGDRSAARPAGSH